MLTLLQHKYMTKKQFKRHLTRLVELKTEVEKIEDVMRKSTINDDFRGGLLGLGWYEDLLVDILEDTMEDTGHNISYWIYELEMGTKWKKGTITDTNNKDVKLKTINDLYNCIINNK